MGGLPRRCRRGGRQRYPAGGVSALSPVNPAFNLLPCPYPPSPLPRWGRGDYRLFYARGCAPCIPGAEPARHWFALPLWKTQWGACPGVVGAAGVSGTRREACPLCRLPTLPLWCPRGACRFWSPANPAFSLLPCPPSPEGKDRPPPPFPGGEGGESLFSFARGFAPCIPGAEPARHWLCLWKTGSLGFAVASAPAGATGTRVVKANCPRGTCMAETVSAASGLMPGCRGR